MKGFLVFGLCFIASISAGSIGLGIRQTPRLVSEPAPRIIGGAVANAGEFPFTAAIYQSTADGTYFCGGALVSTQFVMTAGHCVLDAHTFTVILGKIHLLETGGLQLTTATYSIHPDFNAETFAADLGIIKFRLPIEFTDYIKPAQLPTVDLTENLQVYALGWGATDDDSSAPVNELNFVTVVVLTRSECEATYGNQVPDTVACVAGSNVEGPCRGDLGSPLATVLNHHMWIVGVNSFVRAGASCEVPEPAGYTKLYPFLPWIKEVTGLP